MWEHVERVVMALLRGASINLHLPVSLLNSSKFYTIEVGPVCLIPSKQTGFE